MKLSYLYFTLILIRYHSMLQLFPRDLSSVQIDETHVLNFIRFLRNKIRLKILWKTNANFIFIESSCPLGPQFSAKTS